MSRVAGQDGSRDPETTSRHTSGSSGSRDAGHPGSVAAGLADTVNGNTRDASASRASQSEDDDESEDGKLGVLENRDFYTKVKRSC